MFYWMISDLGGWVGAVWRRGMRGSHADLVRAPGLLWGLPPQSLPGARAHAGAPLPVCLLHLSAPLPLSHPLSLSALTTLSLPLWLSLSPFVAPPQSFLEARLWSEWWCLVPPGARRQGSHSLFLTPPPASSFWKFL